MDPLSGHVERMDEKQTPKIGKGKAGPGRPKGVPNKKTTLLKDAILQAAESAGGEEGLVGYLAAQAKDNPGPFLALLGKVLPTQMNLDLGVSDPLKDLMAHVYENGKRLGRG